MADPRATVHALMRGLVNRHFKTQQSAAKEIADYWHPMGNCGDDYDTADLSRKMNGSRRWTTDDVMALAAITGSNRVTDAMRGAGEATGPCNTLSALSHARNIVKEHGEGIAALISFSEGGCAEKARAELLDIREVVVAALRDIDRQNGRMTR